MYHIGSFGFNEKQIKDFFSKPIDCIYSSPVEGNRIFEVAISSISEESISISSKIFDLSDVDEIGVISIKDIS